LAGADHERLAYEGNDWLMRTMARECHRPSVTAVHSYEDCSLWAFEEARRLGKACLYDQPIGYYPAWQETQARLVRERADWLPAGGAAITRHVRPEQKRREMELADLVLSPSTFVLNTIRQFHPAKAVALAPYGVDLDYWHPNSAPRPEGPLRFLYVGQCSIRKGIPLLLDAWAAADLPDAQLDLVGGWHLAEHVLGRLPRGVVYRGPSAREALRRHYQQADVFILPSYFEGFGLVILEAMACGLPVIASDATAGPDLFAGEEGLVFPVGNRDRLVEALRSYAAQRDRLPQLQRAARTRAEQFTWTRYRQCVADAVAPFAGRAPVVASAAVPA
jgi:alpha-maltose-1-phosphate synthase